MSLVAAVAVTGLSTTSFAQPLEDAIKNVEVSGVVTYRYNDKESTNLRGHEQDNNYKISMDVKSKVNEDVTANMRFIVGSPSNGPATLSTSTNGDQSVNVTLSEVNFVYTGLANTSIIVGKQGLFTPFTVARDDMDNESTGTGIVAVTSVGPATFAAAYFNQTNLNTTTETVAFTGSEDVVFASAAVAFAGINLDAAYIDVSDYFDAYTLGLSGSFDISDLNLSPYVRYSSLDLDNVSTDNNLWKLGLRAQMGIFGAHIGYGETDKEGGVVGTDVTSETGYDEHWNVTLTGNADAEVFYLDANAQVTPTINLALAYSEMDKKAGNDEDEVYGQITYDMSKNFNTWVRFGSYDIDGEDSRTVGRLQVQYTF